VSCSIIFFSSGNLMPIASFLGLLNFQPPVSRKVRQQDPKVKNCHRDDTGHYKEGSDGDPGRQHA